MKIVKIFLGTRRLLTQPKTQTHAGVDSGIRTRDHRCHIVQKYHATTLVKVIADNEVKLGFWKERLLMELLMRSDRDKI